MSNASLPSESADAVQRRTARIWHECVRRGWDLGELAQRAGISRTALYHLLEGHTERPRAKTLQKLASALDIPVDELLATGRSAPAAPAPQEADTPPPIDHTAAIQKLAEERPLLLAGWTAEEFAQLGSMFNSEGGLASRGVVSAAESINRRRETLRQLAAVLDTHLRDVAINFVELLYRMTSHDARNPPGE